MHRVQDEEDEEEPMHHVRLHGSIKSPLILVGLTVDDCLFKMELDTGPLCQSCLKQPFKSCGLGGT